MHCTHAGLPRGFQILQGVFDQNDFCRRGAQAGPYLLHQRARRLGADFALQMHVVDRPDHVEKRQNSQRVQDGSRILFGCVGQ